MNIFCYYFDIRPRQLLLCISLLTGISPLSFINKFIYNASSMISCLVYFKAEKEHKSINKAQILK